jgi:hypothetical protein
VAEECLNDPKRIHAYYRQAEELFLSTGKFSIVDKEIVTTIPQENLALKEKPARKYGKH